MVVDPDGPSSTAAAGVEVGIGVLFVDPTGDGLLSLGDSPVGVAFGAIDLSSFSKPGLADICRANSGLSELPACLSAGRS
jgi:hypothetical protein